MKAFFMLLNKEVNFERVSGSGKTPNPSQPALLISQESILFLKTLLIKSPELPAQSWIYNQLP
jgi:hypothetical protein